VLIYFHFIRDEGIITPRVVSSYRFDKAEINTNARQVDYIFLHSIRISQMIRANSFEHSSPFATTIQSNLELAQILKAEMQLL
jgi:hypothetical protein